MLNRDALCLTQHVGNRFQKSKSIQQLVDVLKINYLLLRSIVSFKSSSQSIVNF